VVIFRLGFKTCLSKTKTKTKTARFKTETETCKSGSRDVSRPRLSLENSKSGYFTSKIYFIFSAPNAYILTNNGFHQIVRPTRAKPPCCLHGPIKTAPTNERCHCLYFVGNSVIDKNRKKNLQNLLRSTNNTFHTIRIMLLAVLIAK